MIETHELFPQSGTERDLELCYSPDPDEREDGLLGLARRARDAEWHVGLGVRRMRDRGDTWATIGKYLGVSRQAAQQRFGTSTDRRSR